MPLLKEKRSRKRKSTTTQQVTPPNTQPLMEYSNIFSLNITTDQYFTSTEEASTDRNSLATRKRKENVNAVARAPSAKKSKQQTSVENQLPLIDKPKQVTVNLKDLTLRQIHQTIIAAVNLKNSAFHLGVVQNTFKKHLAKFGTTYKQLKQLTEEEAAIQFTTYDKISNPIPADLDNPTLEQVNQTTLTTNNASELTNSPTIAGSHLETTTSQLEHSNQIKEKIKVNLNKLTLRQMHQFILKQNNIDELATVLNISHSIIVANYLLRFGTNFSDLKELTQEQAESEFSNYDQSIKKPKVNLNRLTMHQIHQVILATKTIKEAIIHLDVSHQKVLKAHLARLGTTYQALKELSEELAVNKFEYYDQVLDKHIPKLDDYTLREIHRAILATTNISNAATYLGTPNTKTLATKLAKIGISFEELKALTEEQAANEFNNYDQIIKTNSVNLNELSLRQIHEVILTTNNLSEATTHLGIVNPRSLEAHLGKLGTSYKALVELTIESALLQIEHYDQIIKTAQVDLDHFTLHQIHQIILTTKTVGEATNRLGLSNSTSLEAHLAKRGTNYKMLKALSAEQAMEELEYYDQIIKTVKTNLDDLTLHKLHLFILSTQNLSEAAAHLGIVKPRSLEVRLGKLGTSYKVLKKLTVENGTVLFDHYDQVVKTAKLDWNKLTMRQIHQVILATETINEAIIQLDVSDKRFLKAHLAKLGTTYQTLKELSEVMAAAQFEHYDQILDKSITKLDYYTLRQIHRAILATTNSSDAANYLGTPNKKTLETKLAKIGVRFGELKALTEEQAAAKFNNYDQIIKTNPVNLNELSLRQIHLVILAKQNLSEVSTHLGIVNPRSLEAHLGKLGTSYEALQKLTIEDAMLQFEHYDQFIKTAKVDLNNFTLHQVHQVILTTETLAQAANRLGISNPISLEAHMAKHGTNYKMLKELSEEKAMQQFEYYDQVKKTVKPNLDNLTLHELHLFIMSTKSISEAATNLGIVHSRSLAAHLGKFGTSYNALKQLTIENATLQFEHYDQIVKTAKVNLDNLTLHQIHQAILTTKTVGEAANRLGFSNSTSLEAHIAKLGTNYNILKKLSEENAMEQFDYYDLLIKTTKTNLANFTLHAIHLFILSTKSLSEAATSLGIVNPKYLENHLAKFNLNYQILTTLTEEEARDRFPDYEQTQQVIQVDVNKFTLHQIHQAILASNDLSEAAALLGIFNPSLLEVHLATLGVDYALLKPLTEDFAAELFSNYDEPQHFNVPDIEIANMAIDSSIVTRPEQDVTENMDINFATENNLDMDIEEIETPRIRNSGYISSTNSFFKPKKAEVEDDDDASPQKARLQDDPALKKP